MLVTYQVLSEFTKPQSYVLETVHILCFISMNSSNKGDLHQQAICYVYVLYLQSTLLKLSCNFESLLLFLTVKMPWATFLGSFFLLRKFWATFGLLLIKIWATNFSPTWQHCSWCVTPHLSVDKHTEHAQCHFQLTHPCTSYTHANTLVRGSVRAIGQELSCPPVKTIDQSALRR